MTHAEMEAALVEANRTFSICDSVAGHVARILVGRLRNVGNHSVLSKLKAELSRFDSRTGRWKP